jgi:1-pyrroline-5-carboxylate dehydrogenase
MEKKFIVPKSIPINLMATKTLKTKSAKNITSKKAPVKKASSKSTGFINEPATDFSNPKELAAMRRAIESVREMLGEDHPAIIGSDKIFGSESKLISTNPCNHREVIGTFTLCSASDAERAIEVASRTFDSWKKVPVEKRAQYLRKAAALMRKRKHEFSAAMILEAGKNFAEADLDTAEAIDFMEFYAHDAIRLCNPQPVVKSPAWQGFKEENGLSYIPLGVGAILPPWNFPLAILVGMTTAAIVTGNTTVLKPSPDTPFIASMFIELMEEVGLPKGVINILYGGADVGAAMVASPQVRFISFTGSKVVGLKINEAAAKPQQGQKWMKRVIAEMGGKDAVIVDSEANLDLAAQGVAQSAFGFSGQKCSACSRVIVDEKVYDAFLEKLVAQTAKRTLGNAEDNAPMSAVSSEKAFEKITEYIDIGKREGRLIYGGKSDRTNGWFIEPTLVADVSENARIAQEEIFGPVLACIKAKNYDDALRIANNTEYGLTGGVFSKNKKKIARAREEFFVGNLYLNRKITGALVGVHPFGGFNMSGTDSKAGGRDYLLYFLQGKSIAERVSF